MLTLFGGAVWWLPRWLAAVLPHVDIEGEPEPPSPGPAVEPRRDGATAAQPMPGTDPWPEPSPTVHHPGDGQVRPDHVPND
jgi:hypothetical protein